MNHTSPAAQPWPFGRLLVSGLILVIAFGGVFVNFVLISDAMAGVVGGHVRIGSFSVAHIHALVIIIVELTMGVFLMESLHVTRLIPVFGSLPKELRTRMTVVSIGILIFLTAAQLGSIYMAEVLLQRGDATRPPPAEWPLAGKLGLALILPLALAFVAMPLDSFVAALRALLRPNPAARR